MIQLIRTSSDNPHFVKLVKLLDADLAIRDGDEHSIYSQFNSINEIKFVVLAYKNKSPQGCGAIKEFGSDVMEVKRMYILPSSRKLGIASRILTELEHWSTELSKSRCILETGKKQPEAIALYLKNGYKQIPNMANTWVWKTVSALKNSFTKSFGTEQAFSVFSVFGYIVFYH